MLIFLSLYIQVFPVLAIKPGSRLPLSLSFGSVNNKGSLFDWQSATLIPTYMTPLTPHLHSVTQSCEVPTCTYSTYIHTCTMLHVLYCAGLIDKTPPSPIHAVESVYERRMRRAFCLQKLLVKPPPHTHAAVEGSYMTE